MFFISLQIKVFMRRFLLLSILFSLFFVVRSQDFRYGFFAGANLNTMKLADELYIHNDKENTDKLISLGFRAGFFGEYSINKHLGIQADLSFSQYGYRLINELEFIGENNSIIYDKKIERMSNDISLALMFKFYLLDKRVAIDIGLQPSYTCDMREFDEEKLMIDSLHVNFSTTILSDSIIHMKKDANYNAFNLSAIGGITCMLSDHFFFNARYVFGLTDIFVEEVVRFDDYDTYYTEAVNQLSRNRVVQLGFGWKF